MTLSGRLRLSATSTKENEMTRKDRFIWKADDIEVHRVTARAIAYDAARIPLREVGVTDADPRQAAHPTIDELSRETENWWTVEVTVMR
jgi:hypothetical protein